MQHTHTCTGEKLVLTQKLKQYLYGLSGVHNYIVGIQVKFIYKVNYIRYINRIYTYSACKWIGYVCHMNAGIWYIRVQLILGLWNFFACIRVHT